jgi:hypothetical protein
MLQAMDLVWTWSTWTWDNYMNYWTEWIHAGDDDDDMDTFVHSIQYHVLFHLVFLVVGIIVLRISGLRMEDKY